MSTSEVGKKTEIKNSTSTAGTTWREREKSDDIPCPALVSFYNHGLLNPEKGGNVKIAELDGVLAKVGVSATIRKVLVKGAEESDGKRDNQFNLFALRGSNLDHSGSTGVRDPKVAPENLENALLKFSESDRMYAKHFAAAANQAQKQDPGIKGTIIQTVELVSLLEVFGRVDDNGKRYFSVDDVKGLWLDGKFPEGWQPQATREIGVVDVMLGVINMMFKRLVDKLGF